MFRSLLFGFALLLLLFSSCEYKPSLEFDREIKKPDSTTISLMLTPQDSVYTFYESSILKYDLRTFGLPVYSAFFYLGEERIKEGNDTTGILIFDWDKHASGTYTLTMVVTTGSNSGSLADLLQAEGFVFSASWKIIFAKANPPSACEIIRIKDTAGTLLIQWQQYNGVAFKHYYLSKAADLNGNIWNEQNIKTIEDPFVTSVFDSTYVGGIAYYRVRVENSGGYTYSYYYVHETNKSNLQATWLGGNKIQLSWNKCQFYRNFQSYTITDETFDNGILFSTDSIGTNSFIYEGGVFGGENKFSISITAKKQSNIYWDNNSSTAIAKCGESFPEFESFNNNDVNSNVYLLNNYKLTRINVATGQNFGTISLPYGTSWCSVSPTESVVIAPYSWGGYIRILPSNFFNPETVSLPNQQRPCMEATLSTSGKGMGLFDFPNSGYMIYNFLDKSLVFSKITDDIGCGKVSFDGNYMVTGNGPGSTIICYEIMNNDFVQVWTHQMTFCDFIPNANLLVCMNTATGLVEILDVATSQVVHSFTVKAGDEYHDTDPFHPLMLFTGNVRFTSQGVMKVYNYMTGTKVLEMVSMNTSWSPFAIQDSTIYSGVGYKVKIR